MSDQPVFVPGRPNRKLLARGAELADLRRQGFSIADIQRYLATRGITIAYSTVRSEIRKLEKGAVPKTPSPVATAPDPATVTATPVPPGTAVEGSKDTGKTKTDEFFDSYSPPNPILERLDRLRNKKP